ncbi:MAG TPA: class II fructose-bisphosphate aldolase [Jatrophihabitans sp.]|jgi:fructose-bisphosphate aldolase class II|uniref:class II fructose-bisphosphate aldolase n=1 Tax=Jatrophihabitans sp. TaxID=1932789 RepID=UPI002F217F9A
MPLAPTRQLVEAARKAGRGVAAFNVITLEHAEAIAAGAEAAGTPVILQISENAVAYHSGNAFPIAAASVAIAAEASVDISLHLDHVEDQQLLSRAADAGFSSVMYDASKLDFADNVSATRDAARWGQAHGLYVEAELGAVGGKGGAHTPGVRTDPDEAARFVADTEVDALAVAVGSSHAMTERTASLDFELITRIGEAVPVPLVLHGSSGVTDADLRTAVRSGIVKVNIGTILNVAFTDAIRRALTDDSLVDPRKYLAPARADVADVVARLAATVSRPA